MTQATKLSRLKAAADRADWREALRIAARFPELGKHGPAIKRAHEAFENGRFYEQLGMKPAELIAAGIDALCKRYSLNATTHGVNTMSKTYTAKSAAVRAARKELNNPQAKPGEDFKVAGSDERGWRYTIPSKGAAAPAAEPAADPKAEPTPAAMPERDPLQIPASLLRPPMTEEEKAAVAAKARRAASPEREIVVRKTQAPKAQAAKAPTDGNAPREGTISRQVYDLLIRPEGATTKDMKAIGLVDISVLVRAKKFAKSYGLEVRHEKEGPVTRVYLSQPAA
ncbi:hypothetical protein BJ122_102252 [Rhodopseudomonas faecalis]|uniref:Uncharacterized protein n=1 Tax=Rhodopseudomonas faecalis TaxID=99655 RepID=A0A318TJY2_9BRAD|nr:hypothetical protein [Rhodopseudomonas faecalis]PYF05026.1 hypothetical protein BJ122_102252 [Rhodopseudomonas faecalis]